MRAPIFSGTPATWDVAFGPPPADLLDPPPPFTVTEALEPVDYRILHLRFAGHPEPSIADDIGRSVEEVKARIARPSFLQTQAEVEKGVLNTIIKQGEFEPTTIAKAAAPSAMRRIIAQSERERDPRTRLAANKTVLQYAGTEPPKRLEITTPDRVIEQMTAQELEDLAERRVWPARFREVLRAFLPAPVVLRLDQKPIDVTPRDPGPPLDHSGLDLGDFADELGLSNPSTVDKPATDR
jgi:hypothetical protein